MVPHPETDNPATETVLREIIIGLMIISRVSAVLGLRVIMGLGLLVVGFTFPDLKHAWPPSTCPSIKWRGLLERERQRGGFIHLE